MAVEALATPTDTVDPSLLLEMVWAARLPLARNIESVKTEVGSNPRCRDRSERENIDSSSSVIVSIKKIRGPARE
jgi:hypothetical protein